MSRSYIPSELRQLVEQRADHHCEYCLVSDDLAFISFEIDHIVAEQHGGQTEESNLALACFDCNRNKGPNIASIDPQSGHSAGLFNPRTDNWEDHFQIDGPTISGLTEEGRATSQLLKMNDRQRIAQRRAAQQERSAEVARDTMESSSAEEEMGEDYDYYYGHGY